jgi:hypothetical protein
MRDAFEPLHAELGDRVLFLGVDVRDTPAAAQRIVEQTGITCQLATNPDGELFTAFGGFGMPTIVLAEQAAAWSRTTPARPAPTSRRWLISISSEVERVG